MAFHPSPVAFTPPPVRRGPGKTCWIVGCIIVVVGGGSIGACCLMPAGLSFWAVRSAGAPAQAWLTAASQGQVEQAGALTVGGAVKAREMLDRLEARIGKLEAPTGGFFGTQAEYRNGVGRIRLPLVGSSGRATGVFEMEKHGEVWQVRDLTFEAP